jgi:hypothetical protein
MVSHAPHSQCFKRFSKKTLRYERVISVILAEKVSLFPGDELIAAEGIEVKERKEIHHALSEKAWENDIGVMIIWEQMRKEISVKLLLLNE